MSHQLGLFISEQSKTVPCQRCIPSPLTGAMMIQLNGSKGSHDIKQQNNDSKMILRTRDYH